MATLSDAEMHKWLINSSGVGRPHRALPGEDSWEPTSGEGPSNHNTFHQWLCLDLNVCTSGEHVLNMNFSSYESNVLNATIVLWDVEIDWLVNAVTVVISACWINHSTKSRFHIIYLVSFHLVWSMESQIVFPKWPTNEIWIWNLMFE